MFSISESRVLAIILVEGGDPLDPIHIEDPVEPTPPPQPSEMDKFFNNQQQQIDQDRQNLHNSEEYKNAQGQGWIKRHLWGTDSNYVKNQEEALDQRQETLNQARNIGKGTTLQNVHDSGKWIGRAEGIGTVGLGIMAHKAGVTSHIANMYNRLRNRPINPTTQRNNDNYNQARSYVINFGGNN